MKMCRRSSFKGRHTGRLRLLSHLLVEQSRGQFLDLWGQQLGPSDDFAQRRQRLVDALEKQQTLQISVDAFHTAATCSFTQTASFFQTKKISKKYVEYKESSLICVSL